MHKAEIKRLLSSERNDDELSLMITQVIGSETLKRRGAGLREEAE